MSLEVSIIVPVYNVEKYLSICIESILAQAYTNYELLLINDGSTDNSGKVCDEYALRDSRIRVFHKNNGGVSSARNLGLSKARGKWITFIDSDDSVSECFLNNLIQFESNDVDIIITRTLNKEEIMSSEYVNRLLRKSVPVELWGKLIRRNIIQDALEIPREIYYGEDMIANIAIGLNAKKKIICLDNSDYNYRINLESVTFHRTVELCYEEMFLDFVEKLISCNKGLYINGLNILRIASLELLVVCKVKVEYSQISWIDSLRKWASYNNLSIRQKIVILVSHNVLCRYLLAIERRLSLFLKTCNIKNL